MSKQKRKCIAVIISKPERKYQEGLLNGICRSAFSHDMNVAVFATTLLTGMDEFQSGEAKIYDLVQYEKFDGVIYAINSFYGHEITNRLSEKMLEISKKGIPVITIDEKVEGLPCFYNDDTNAVKDVVVHLIRDHGVKDIAYMTGHKDHPHAENSLKAYKDIMEEYNLPILAGRTYYGNYWYDTAEDFVQNLVDSRDGLPEAVVCANEYMAIGVYRAFHSRGIYIPRQVRLGCTSNDVSTARYLTTGENSLEYTGYDAAEVLFATINGAPLPTEDRHIPCKNTMITSMTCGCQRTSEYDHSAERGIWVDTEPGFFGESNFFREVAISKKTSSSLFKEFDAYMHFIEGYRGIYFCLCEGWNDPYFLIEDIRNNPYSDMMQLVYYRKENGQEQEPEVYIGNEKFFPSADMFPKLFDADIEPTMFVFRPIHCLDRNFGYVVLDNAQSAKVYDYTFNFWLRDVANSLEAYCRLQSATYMYYTDIMTGIYSRNGFNTMMNTALEEAVSNDASFLLLIADMNGLKHINDTYGHQEGDIAIKASANLLKLQTIPTAIYEENFRIGGDEFVKIAIGNFTEEDGERYKEELRESVKKFSDASNKPYDTSMSLGVSISKVKTMADVDALLAQADKKMYEDKVRLKAVRKD